MCEVTGEQAEDWESVALSGRVQDIQVSLRQGSYILLQPHGQGCDGLASVFVPYGASWYLTQRV